MAELEIKNQPRLGVKRLMELTVTGVRYRLFRSFMTVVVIAVAVAFMLNMLVGSLVTSAVMRDTKERLDELRLASTWLSRVTLPVSVEEVLYEAAAIDFAGERYKELVRFSGTDRWSLIAFKEAAEEAVVYLDFLKGLPYGKRRTLVGPEATVADFDALDDPERRASFFRSLATMRTIEFPASPEAFSVFLKEWPEVRHRAETIREGRNAAVRKIAAYLQDEDALVALTDVDGAFGDVLREAGFILEKDVAADVAALAEDNILIRSIEATLGLNVMQKAWAARLDKDPSDIRPERVWPLLRESGTAFWYLGEVEARTGERPDWKLDEVMRVANQRVELNMLGNVERAGVGYSGDGLLGLGARVTMLIFVSMMVCVVGIANAMLMSVTERYREIATLKCLGALDGSIMMIFILEATFLGVVGGIFGAFLGAAIALMRSAFGFGPVMLESLPVGDIFLSLILAVVMGTVLAAVASVYPSWKAARLAPMEAMRIE